MTFERAIAAMTDAQLATELRAQASEWAATDDGQSLSVAMLMKEAAERLDKARADLAEAKNAEFSAFMAGLGPSRWE